VLIFVHQFYIIFVVHVASCFLFIQLVSKWWTILFSYALFWYVVELHL